MGVLSTMGVFSTMGDILSSVRTVQYHGEYLEHHWGYLEYRGGGGGNFHDACGWISRVLWSVLYCGGNLLVI